jgi:hypothetical protein
MRQKGRVLEIQLSHGGFEMKAGFHEVIFSSKGALMRQTFMILSIQPSNFAERGL